MAETGKKMGDYTPLESNKKEYFLGEGEAGVVAVGKTEAGGTKTNRLVKLSDIAGDKLPSGGTEGQVLTKTSGGAAWAAVPSELPSGGTTGQVLTKTSNGEAWADAPKELPTSGSSGQFLKKTANGVEYASVNEVPAGGTTGQVLTKTASGEAWADPVTELPSGGNVGDVLTQTANGPAWSAPSGGGGGAPYTRATVSFGDAYLENSQYWQDLNIQNNTYNAVNMASYDSDAYHLKIKLPSNTDFPCAIVKIDRSTLEYIPEINEIKVYNGNTLLPRMYPMQVLSNTVKVNRYDNGSWKEYEGQIASDEVSAFTSLGTLVEIHILGDSYIIYNNIGMTNKPGSV